MTSTVKEWMSGDPVSVAADVGSDLSELRVTEALDDMAIRRLQALDRALERAEQGQLEICDDCGGKIALARLHALPAVAVCIECARARDRR
jgi:RNA polymerase-binding transcription factor DksA